MNYFTNHERDTLLVFSTFKVVLMYSKSVFPNMPTDLSSLQISLKNDAIHTFTVGIRLDMYNMNHKESKTKP